MTEERKPLKIFYGLDLSGPSEDMASMSGGLTNAEFARMVEAMEKFDPMARKSHAIAARIRGEK